jgi:16S rRNA processing protein RimM
MKGKSAFDISEELIPVGRILKTHGLRGELKVLPLTNVEEVFKNLKNVVLYNPKNRGSLQVKVEKVRKLNKFFLIKLEGFNTINEVERFRNFQILIEKTDLPELKEDEYYFFQLIDCEVFYNDGGYAGKVIDIIETGSNDVLVVKKTGEKDTTLIPVIKGYIEKLDLENKRIIAREIEWYESE